jgi:hypothetical protein
MTIRRGRWGRALGVLVAAAGLTLAGAISASADGTTTFALSATGAPGTTGITAYSQGFSVESADLAHGFLTKALLARKLKTLGPHGVIRLGGYSMDLVWPAFGAYRDEPPPPQAIGGVVDQSDFDNLEALLDATGWKVTLGVPLKAVIDQSLIKSPTKDPSPPVTLDQAVAEVRAAYQTLGDDLVGVEVGNEFDNVTRLSSAQYYDTLRRYEEAIEAAVPGAHIRMVGPSANTSSTNTVLNNFVSAVLGDTATAPADTLEELSSHYYAGSHCGSSTTSVPALMSASTYTKARTKLQGIMDVGARLDDAVPSVLNETNSASCSGQPGVSDAYATSLWSLDYLLESARAGISRVQFHTNTAAVCGDFQARDSVNYPISYRYYGAFCAADRTALDNDRLTAAPLYYGLWAFRQVPQGHFVDLHLDDAALPQLRAYGIKSDDGKLTVVLVNVQDPASATSTDDDVSLSLPAAYRQGHAITLQSTGAGGLASTDANAITLGARSAPVDGAAPGEPVATPVGVATDGHAAVSVAAGTAQIVTFTG